MLSSSRFIVAVHVLSLLARNAGKGPMCSSAIAESVGTNPVVIRRMMSELEKASLVTSTAGRSGGFELSRGACDISLACVYAAVENDEVFRMHKVNPEADCPVACQLGKILAPRLKEAELALTRSLSGTKLSEVARALN
ncbi:MAG: Rrf2 family transcriptional regulator [Alphaproteobacteria bacterium]|nr:Rrf2 family transcriptional regulator [Alphaproteobacteria bacterium]